jgi:hypothetical protein
MILMIRLYPYLSQCCMPSRRWFERKAICFTDNKGKLSNDGIEITLPISNTCLHHMEWWRWAGEIMRFLADTLSEIKNRKVHFLYFEGKPHFSSDDPWTYDMPFEREPNFNPITMKYHAMKDAQVNFMKINSNSLLTFLTYAYVSIFSCIDISHVCKWSHIIWLLHDWFWNSIKFSSTISQENNIRPFSYLRLSLDFGSDRICASMSMCIAVILFPF